VGSGARFLVVWVLPFFALSIAPTLIVSTSSAYAGAGQAAVMTASVLGSTALGLRNSPHDLSSSSTTEGTKATNAGQTCVFCHTSHQAQKGALLWNHSASARPVNWGSSTTTNGTSIPAVLSPGSRLCLSCHDGSTAVGDVSNAGGMRSTIAVSGLGKLDDSGKLTDKSILAGVGGSMDGTHPVGIAYPGSAGSFYGSTTGISDPLARGYHPARVGADCAVVGTYCTAAGSNDGADGSRIRLYVDPATGGTGIECASCHDTHNKYGNPSLTVVNNDSASALCRSCHRK
jgi:predicted CXXCH cytochrome family protein